MTQKSLKRTPLKFSNKSPFQKVNSLGLYPSKYYEFDEYFAKNYFSEYAQIRFYL